MTNCRLPSTRIMIYVLHFLGSCTLKGDMHHRNMGAIISDIIGIWNLNTFAFPVNSVRYPTVKPLLCSRTYVLHACMPPQVILKTFWNTVFTKFPLTFKEYLFINLHDWRQFQVFTILQGSMKYFYTLIIVRYILYCILCV